MKYIKAVNQESANILDSHIKNNKAIVKYYAPWCGHCKQLAPIWSKCCNNCGVKIRENDNDNYFYDNGRDDNFILAEASDSGIPHMKSHNDVQGFPTILYLENGKKVDEYNGEREINSLEKWMKSKIHSKNGGKERREDSEISNEIKKGKFIPFDKIDDAVICPICQHELKSPENIRDAGIVYQLSCGHQFHNNCLKGWCKINTKNADKGLSDNDKIFRPIKFFNCPICNQKTINEIDDCTSVNTLYPVGKLNKEYESEKYTGSKPKKKSVFDGFFKGGKTKKYKTKKTRFQNKKKTSKRKPIYCAHMPPSNGKHIIATRKHKLKLNNKNYTFKTCCNGCAYSMKSLASSNPKKFIKEYVAKKNKDHLLLKNKQSGKIVQKAPLVKNNSRKITKKVNRNKKTRKGGNMSTGFGIGPFKFTKETGNKSWNYNSDGKLEPHDQDCYTINGVKTCKNKEEKSKKSWYSLW